MATSAKCAVSLVSIKAQRPAARSDQAMLGKVNSNRARRPNVSIVHNAGKAKRKLISPKPKEAQRACMAVNPEFLKMVVE